jgi:hypothetical protein
MPHSVHHSSRRSTRRHHRRHDSEAAGPLVGMAALIGLIVAALWSLFALGE